MSDALLVGIITAAVSLIGIFVSAKATQDTVMHKLDVNQNLINNEIIHIKENMTEMKQDIKQHNSYAKMFQENIPAIKQHQTDTDRRIEMLENRAQ